MLAITLVSPDPAALAEATAAVRAALAVTAETVLGEAAVDFLADAAPSEAHMAVKAAVGALPVDFAVQPAEGRRKRLLIADMDSTIINVECLDELADFAGLKAEISAITERAMRGELAFEGALRERVGMLKGLSADALQACYDDRVKLNPGPGPWWRPPPARRQRHPAGPGRRRLRPAASAP